MSGMPRPIALSAFVARQEKGLSLTVETRG
jgi:hypothetical protein